LDARGNGGIVVGRQVQVIGRGDVDAAIAGVAEHRGKKAGGAFVVDRKAYPGQVEHRHVRHAQLDVAGGAAAFFVVQRDVLALDKPAVVAGFAAGVHAIVDGDHAIGV